MSSRRSFIGTVASGLATTIAAPGSVLGANDRVRLGIIGTGDRGTQLVREALAQPGVEFAAFSDIYSRRLEDAKKLVPSAAAHYDYRRLLDDKSVDAVLIATPHHLHCEHFVAALDAGKHVYQEKTMAFTVDHAKRMRAAFQQGGQAGRANRPSGLLVRTRGRCAYVSAPGTGSARSRRFDADMYRNTPHGKPQWSRPVYPGHDAGKCAVELIPGRSAEAYRSTPIATLTGGSSGTIRAAISTRTCATRSHSGTKY